MFLVFVKFRSLANAVNKKRALSPILFGKLNEIPQRYILRVKKEKKSKEGEYESGNQVCNHYSPTQQDYIPIDSSEPL